MISLFAKEAFCWTWLKTEPVLKREGGCFLTTSPFSKHVHGFIVMLSFMQVDWHLSCIVSMLWWWENKSFPKGKRFRFQPSSTAGFPFRQRGSPLNLVENGTSSQKGRARFLCTLLCFFCMQWLNQFAQRSRLQQYASTTLWMLCCVPLQQEGLWTLLFLTRLYWEKIKVAPLQGSTTNHPQR